MPAQAMLDSGAYVGLVFTSLLYLFFSVVVVLKSAKSETRLLGMGVLTAVAAISYGSLGGPLGVHVSASGVSAGVAIGGLAASLMKIAVILVLASVASGLWPRTGE